MKGEDSDWTINFLDRAGLLTTDSNKIPYKRPKSLRMMESLDSILLSSCLRVWITGSPGVGKSTTLFGILNTPNVSRQEYLWVHADYTTKKWVDFLIWKLILRRWMITWADFSLAMKRIFNDVDTIDKKFTTLEAAWNWCWWASMN